MSSTYLPGLLSGSTNGRPIAVAATSSPGTLIHTAAAASGANQFDEIWLWATNIDSADRVLTLQFGGTTTADEIMITVKAGQTIMVLAGNRLNNGLILKAFADAANKVNLFGNVNNVS